MTFAYFYILEKCLSPFNVNTQQLFNKLIITWESPQNIVQYELQYKEAMQRTSSWIPVSVEMKAFNVTIPDVNPTASYMVRIRCIPKNNRCTVCLWTEETSVPYKLTKKLTILENTTKEISQGKRSLFLTWETCETKRTIGYFIHIKRIPDSFHGIISLNIKKTSLNLNLSMAAYNIKITAYNEHGNSSSVTYRVPDFMSTYSSKLILQKKKYIDFSHVRVRSEFSLKNILFYLLTFLLTLIDLPGHIIISNQQNYTIITWNLKYNPDCLAIDWGTGTADMKSKCLCQNETSVILDNLQPYQLYKVMLHTLDRQSKDLMKDERTLAMANFYAMEGVPRIGPANVTITVVDKHSAIVKWTEIPTKDCLGFLLEYRIYCTKVANNISWDQGEFEGMVVSLCLGLIIIPAITITICSLLLKRSRKLCWPPVPNPRDSSAMQVAEKTFPVALLRPNLQPLLPSVPLNEANKLYVIKDDLEAFPQQMFLSTSPATGRVSTEYSEAIVEQKEGTLPKPHKRVNASEKAKGGLHLDYVGMEFSHKAMQKFPENLPMKTVHL
ncbi:hypothetical protein NXF25_007278 [Crotalus adamanteus]|uniref:Fibronectin type-III domain-containing protein n=1 Tax=Crotalus adamanteus TaxID=8729 RepID=A0AAW1C2D1_CROAD